MSSPKRRSLRDRNSSAIAHDPYTPPAGAAPPSSPAAGEKPTTPKPASPVGSKGRPGRPASAAAGETTRLGIYFRDGEFEAAKAAYLADWQHGGESDTFARWIAAAIDTHAGRTTKQRAELARETDPAATRGGSRSFTIPTSTALRMRQAIVEDQGINRWLSDSAWCGEAITAAVASARSRAGGTLPTPPSRLPNRLTR